MTIAARNIAFFWMVKPPPCWSSSFRSRGPSWPLEDIGVHYAETLARWRRAFSANLGRVRALGFDERFVRMWDYYLCVCEAAFATRTLGDLQIVFTRPCNDALPGIRRRRAAA